MTSDVQVSHVKFWSWVAGAFLVGALLGSVLGIAGFVVLMALIS